MSSRRRGDTYTLDEVPVNLSIREGKLTVESKSGPKSGSVQLIVDDTGATLALNGAGSDQATAALTGPELTNFRTMVDATLSTLSMRDEPPMGRDVLFSGFRPLDEFDGGFGVVIDEESLRKLGLLTADGGIAGGSRQVQCTVLGNGTAILNLAGDGSSGSRR